MCLVIGSIFFLQKKSSCWEEEEGGGGSCFIFTHNVSKVISRAIIAMQSIPISSNPFSNLSGCREEIIHVDKMKHIPVQYLFKKKSFHARSCSCSLAVTALTTVANHQLPPCFTLEHEHKKSLPIILAVTFTYHHVVVVRSRCIIQQKMCTKQEPKCWLSSLSNGT